MELRRALAMFRLAGRVPMEELNSSFRDLVKKYHPDKVRDYPEWAHERMAEINDAYETLAAWLAESPGVDEQPGETREQPDFEREIHRRETPAFTDRAAARFYPLFNAFLDGLGLYYQYGLEKTAYRKEGVRRFRYREAIRSAEKYRDGLEQLAEKVKHPAVQSAARFSRLMAADMIIGDPVFPPGPAAWSNFDRRIRSARRKFDSAVRDILFPELMPSHRKGQTTALLYSSYTEFILYVTVFTEGERRKTGILQAARYDAFMDLLELRNEGILQF